ncbi:ACT domain-containing protein [Chitinimonas taiwanensis]|uniref:DUF2241 domain-containing protein n=1 Tax=Chitinimonas taiwanensis DSM 18899 TaxID=1121279 RepID=A0A1K2HRY0_9NEIS|nr:ACT domain-containing protein [Chitinimonas taiwanensis]SFZ79026.1 hypothetical protein SAMN02745887_03333 [Chitinimonas taiwanensis DSM 18899]
MTQAIRALDTLLATMTPVLNLGVYAFACLDAGRAPDQLPAIATLREQEGWTVVLPLDAARQHGLNVLFEAAWISLHVHSDLAAVGLTAAFAGALAEQGIACNVLAGAYHDHLFVPHAEAEAAMAALLALQARHST